MTKAYSTDLRIRAVLAVVGGERVGKTAKLFGISERTLFIWRKQYDANGKTAPIKNYQCGYGHKIKDLDSFRDFVIKNNSLTAKQMALKLGNMGQSTVKRYLKKINFSRKKNFWLCQSQRRKASNIFKQACEDS
jgi:transposase-like protein